MAGRASASAAGRGYESIRLPIWAARLVARQLPRRRLSPLRALYAVRQKARLAMSLSGCDPYRVFMGFAWLVGGVVLAATGHLLALFMLLPAAVSFWAAWKERERA